MARGITREALVGMLTVVGSLGLASGCGGRGGPAEFVGSEVGAAVGGEVGEKAGPVGEAVGEAAGAHVGGEAGEKADKGD